MSTPEGRVKDKVKKVLTEFKGTAQVGLSGETLGRDFELYAHWPVQNGMGAPSLDCIVCYRGLYIAIETKAPGKSPTPRQQLTMNQIRSAGGVVFVISDDEGIEQLRRALQLIKWSHANDSQSQA